MGGSTVQGDGGWDNGRHCYSSEAHAADEFRQSELRRIIFDTTDPAIDAAAHAEFEALSAEHEACYIKHQEIRRAKWTLEF